MSKNERLVLICMAVLVLIVVGILGFMLIQINQDAALAAQRAIDARATQARIYQAMTQDG